MAFENLIWLLFVISLVSTEDSAAACWPRWVEYQETHVGFLQALLTPSLQKYLFHEVHLKKKKKKFFHHWVTGLALAFNVTTPSAVRLKKRPSCSAEEQIQNSCPLQTTTWHTVHICTQLATQGSLMHSFSVSNISSIMHCLSNQTTCYLHSETDFIWWRRCLYPVSSTIWNQCFGRWTISMYRRCTWINWNMRCSCNAKKSRSHLYALLCPPASFTNWLQLLSCFLLNLFLSPINSSHIHFYW